MRRRTARAAVPASSGGAKVVRRVQAVERAEAAAAMAARASASWRSVVGRKSKNASEARLALTALAGHAGARTAPTTSAPERATDDSDKVLSKPASRIVMMGRAVGAAWRTSGAWKASTLVTNTESIIARELLSVEGAAANHQSRPALQRLRAHDARAHDSA